MKLCPKHRGEAEPKCPVLGGAAGRWLWPQPCGADVPHSGRPRGAPRARTAAQCPAFPFPSPRSPAEQLAAMGLELCNI